MTTVQENLIPSPVDDSVLDGLLAVAERLVEKGRTRHVDGMEVYVQTGIGRQVSIEKDAVGFTQAGGEAGLGIRVQTKRRMGFAYCSDPADGTAAIERAIDVAKRAPEGTFQFPGAQDHPVVGKTWDHRLVEFDTATGLDAVRAMIDGAHEVHKGASVAGGSVGVGIGASAIVNSEGLEFAARSTGIGHSAYVVLKDGNEVTTGFKGNESTQLDGLANDPAAIGREAAELAKRTLGATPWGDGRAATVVFTPEATASLIEFITLPALHGDRAARGESLFADKLGQPVCDPHIILRDDPTRSGGLGSSPADDEGCASRAVPLLEGGLVQNFLYDLSSAYEYGDGPESATASAVRAGGISDDRTYQEAPTTGARNAVLTATDPRPLDTLVADVDNGILVHDLLGAHTANPTSGDFSVSSTVLFEIRDGSIEGALAGVMLAGNLPKLLENGFRGVSLEREQGSGHFSPVCLDMPHLALSGVHVVGA